MILSFLSRLARFFTESEPIWIIVWAGLVALSVLLLLLTRTRWGQSRPLQKCAVLSLLAHVLLACLATTVHIVTGVAGTPDPPALRVAIVSGPQSPDEREPKPTAPEPWATVTTDADAQPDTGHLQRSDQEQPMPLHEPAAPVARRMPEDLIAAATTPPSDGADAEPAESAPQRTMTKAAALAIETPESNSQESPDIETLLPTPTLERATNTPLPNVGERSIPKQPLPQPIENLVSTPDSSEATDQLLESDTSLHSAGEPAPSASAAPAQVADAAAGDDTDGRHKVTPTPTPQGDENSVAAADGDSQVARSDASQGDRRSLPDVYRDRTARDRDKLVTARGGSGDTEASVRAALRWLAAAQSDDGRWNAAQYGAGQEKVVLGHNRQFAGMRADTGITGLALLAFLGAGHTHLDGTHQKTVRSGLEFLLREQRADGNLAGSATMYAQMYCHAMATFALSEAYAMTGDKRLHEPVRRAIQYSLNAQNPSGGGWRYQPSDKVKDPGDTSQLGWQVMALRSAELAGVEVPDETWHRIRRFLRSVASGKQGGLASYRPYSSPSRTMTAEALVCRQICQAESGHEANREAADYIVGELPGTRQANLYFWYYATLGLYQQQGPSWQRWNDAVTSALVQRQQTSGSDAGSWPPDTVWGGYGGRVYSTAMATLCLEVYYRYAPPARIMAGRRDGYK